MKYLKYIILIIALTVTSNARLNSYGNQKYSFHESSINENSRNHDTGRTYNKRTCRGGYRALKKAFKSEAKRLCSEQHNSPLGNQLKKTHFFKVECKKIKRSGHKTKVKVGGSYEFTCR